MRTASLPGKLPICGVMGDSQASLFAQRCFEPGTAKATFGSGTSVLLNIGRRVRAVGPTALCRRWPGCGRPPDLRARRDHQLFVGDDRLAEGPARPDRRCGGNRVARQRRRGQRRRVPRARVCRAERAVLEPDARAAIVGMTALHAKRAHRPRGAGIDRLSNSRRAGDDAIGQPASRRSVLYADGGPTRNEFLMQFIADMTGLELVVAEVAESSARGAAMAAMLGLGRGRFARRTWPPCRGDVRTYRPQMDADKVEQLYAGWQQAVQRVL